LIHPQTHLYLAPNTWNLLSLKWLLRKYVVRISENGYFQKGSVSCDPPVRSFHSMSHFWEIIYEFPCLKIGLRIWQMRRQKKQHSGFSEMRSEKSFHSKSFLSAFRKTRKEKPNDSKYSTLKVKYLFPYCNYSLLWLSYNIINWRCHTQNRQIKTVVTMNYLKTGIKLILHNPILGLCRNGHHHHHHVKRLSFLKVCKYHSARSFAFMSFFPMKIKRHRK
jgi:hypothetical protein